MSSLSAIYVKWMSDFNYKSSEEQENRKPGYFVYPQYVEQLMRLSNDARIADTCCTIPG